MDDTPYFDNTKTGSLDHLPPDVARWLVRLSSRLRDSRRMRYGRKFTFYARDSSTDPRRWEAITRAATELARRNNTDIVEYRAGLGLIGAPK